MNREHLLSGTNVPSDTCVPQQSHTQRCENQQSQQDNEYQITH
jgi:hypothetical protein